MPNSSLFPMERLMNCKLKMFLLVVLYILMLLYIAVVTKSFEAIIEYGIDRNKKFESTSMDL